MSSEGSWRRRRTRRAHLRMGGPNSGERDPLVLRSAIGRRALQPECCRRPTSEASPACHYLALVCSASSYCSYVLKPQSRNMYVPRCHLNFPSCLTAWIEVFPSIPSQRHVTLPHGQPGPTHLVGTATVTSARTSRGRMV